MFTSLLQAYHFQNLCSNVQKLCFYNFPLGFELNDDLKLLNSLYQQQFKKNYDSLCSEYKETVNPNISFVALKTFAATRPENIEYEINCLKFLCH